MSNADWFGFGREILAVVDRTVYAARDGIADNQALVEPAPPASLSADDVYGNYVILAVGNGTIWDSQGIPSVSALPPPIVQLAGSFRNSRLAIARARGRT